MASFTGTTTTADCQADDGGGYYNGAYVSLGSNSATTTVRAYFPFNTVTIEQGATISSATIRFTSYNTDSSSSCKVRFRCADADNVSNPGNNAAVYALAVTSANYTATLASWSTGSNYTYTITNAVQEVIDRAGWASGNRLAVVVDDNGSTADVQRSVEDVTAYISISYTNPVVVTVTPSGILVPMWFV